MVVAAFCVIDGPVCDDSVGVGFCGDISCMTSVYSLCKLCFHEEMYTFFYKQLLIGDEFPQKKRSLSLSLS